MRSLYSPFGQHFGTSNLQAKNSIRVVIGSRVTNGDVFVASLFEILLRDVLNSNLLINYDCCWVLNIWIQDYLIAS